MTDVPKSSPPPAHADDTKPTVVTAKNAKWVAAGMGIGSAALVAALLYSNRGKKPPKG